MNHTEAQTVCQQSERDGHQDWRLPTVKELGSITSYRGSGRPFTDRRAFSIDCPNWGIWSSTPVVGTDEAMRDVRCSGGYVGDKLKDADNLVMCVREP